jgi:hypothetical protein
VCLNGTRLCRSNKGRRSKVIVIGRRRSIIVRWRGRIVIVSRKISCRLARTAQSACAPESQEQRTFHCEVKRRCESRKNDLSERLSREKTVLRMSVVLQIEGVSMSIIYDNRTLENTPIYRMKPSLTMSASPCWKDHKQVYSREIGGSAELSTQQLSPGCIQEQHQQWKSNCDAECHCMNTVSSRIQSHHILFRNEALLWRRRLEGEKRNPSEGI